MRHACTHVYKPISIGLVGNVPTKRKARTTGESLQTDFDRVSWKHASSAFAGLFREMVYKPISIGLVGNHVSHCNSSGFTRLFTNRFRSG